ncbi:carbohydrate-binding module family 50 protein [Apiospora arundinis]
MDRGRVSERLNDEVPITAAECTPLACEDSSDSSSTAPSKDIDEEILKLLRAIQHNGERQLRLLEAVVSGNKVPKETQRTVKPQKKAPKKKPSLAYKPGSSFDPWPGAQEGGAPDLFTSSEEDQKLSMVIILGILRVTPSLLDELNINESAWDFLLHHRHVKAPWMSDSVTGSYETEKGSRTRRLKEFIQEFRSPLIRRGLPEVVLRRNGMLIRLRFPDSESRIGEMNPDLAQHIIRGWLQRPDFGFSPYGEPHEIFPHEIFRRTCRVGTGPVRMTDNVFHFQQMALIMEFMAVQAPRGPVAPNIEAAWDFMLAFVSPWKTREGFPCSRLNGFWTSPKDPIQAIELETLTLQHFMRVFSTIQQDSVHADRVRQLELGGVRMSRIAGGLERTRVNKANQPLFRRLELTEKRLGQMMVISLNRESPVYKMIRLTDLAVGISTPEPEETKVDSEPGAHRWYSGITIFQEAVLANFMTWNQEWEETLYHIDVVLKVQLEDIFDPTTRLHLMFESSSNSKFEQSETYFFVIELLRIASDWISEAVADLDTLRAWTDRIAYGHEDIDSLIETKWVEILDVARKKEADLLARIEKKRLEVYSLRDGLFNATSVRESTKGTHINEYILVFTVMTVLYLPLGFMATLYGIDMFDFSVPGQTTQFAITTSVVSGVTYLAASGLLYGVRRRRKNGSYREVWAGLMRDTATLVAQFLSQLKDASGTQAETKVEELFVQNGIPEHLKNELFTDSGQHVG